MSLTTGVRLGPYEIVAAIGAGGMGEVYRAHDTKLNRDVAIKVLPPELASDPERRERFTREAHVLASLNHPHIAAIYGLEEAHGIRALVMELVEGLTLAEVIGTAFDAGPPNVSEAGKAVGVGPHGRVRKAGPLPIEEALAIAKQIAEALEAAHELGIIHRDLKPANIKVKDDGTVKVLDFGLAKALDLAGGAAGVGAIGDSPTITSPAAMTHQGVILGTAAYMPPEQAKGRAVDKRADIWAFGCVLFEMLAGKRAFDGEDVFDTLTAVVKSEPDWKQLPAEMPTRVIALVRRCLKKDARERLRDIGDARIEIDDVLAGATEQSTISAASTHATRRERFAWSLAAVSVVALVAALALDARYWSRTADLASPLWVSLTAPERDFGPSPAPAVSPDGRTVAFAAPDKTGQIVLWIRALDTPTARALPGTEGAGEPFWSPDGRSLAFFGGGKLKRVDITGASAPQVLADAPNQRGGTWGGDGVIVFAPTPNAPLHRVSAAGGAAVPLRLDKADEQVPQYPSFLPDGRHFLFTNIYGPEGARGVWVASLGATSVARIGGMRSRATYSSGHLLFGRGRELYVQRFDPDRLQLTGEPIRVAENLGMSFGGVASYAFSTSGGDVLAYGTGVNSATTQRRWLDRRGASLGTVGELGMYASLVLSPDERQLAVERSDPTTITTDVWTIDLRTGVASRFTTDPDGLAICPLWSADGKSILFRVTVAGALRVTSLDGKKTDEIPIGGAGTGSAFPSAWSADGRFVVFQRSDPKTLNDLWLAPLAGDRKPRPYLQTPFNELGGRVSPDSHWLAYVSDESGRQEVYVQSFPEPGSKRRVSTNGGRQLLWDKRGTELYYLSLDQKLMAATVSGAGSSLELSLPHALFDAPRVPPDSARFQYAVTADGERFLFNAVTTDLIERGITVVMHWPATLKK